MYGHRRLEEKWALKTLIMASVVGVVQAKPKGSAVLEVSRLRFCPQMREIFRLKTLCALARSVTNHLHSS